jgi:hypothetical protein
MGAINAQILLIWLNTDAFVEYMSLFCLGNFLCVNEYKQVSVDDPSLSYPTFLATNYNSFLTRLFNCPKCVGVQISALLNIILFIFLEMKFSPWMWLLFPFSVLITSYFSLYMYFSIVLLMKRQ